MGAPATSTREARTLIFAPTEQDAELIGEVIARAGSPCHIVSSIEELCKEIRNGAAAAILAEEALSSEAFDRLQPILREQPSWSDFPLLVLIAAGRVTAESERLHSLRQPLGNLLLLERPIRPETLLSSLEAALRGRGRQYQIRDQIHQAELAQEALRRSEKLAVTGRLAASIAHEINNPLEAITNLLFLARSESDLTQVRQYLLLADQELARVTEITKHTLRFYREPTQPAQIDLVKVADSVLTLYTSRLSSCRIHVHRQIRAASVLLTAPLGELRQVVANIVGNALDAMRSGGTLAVRVSVESRAWSGGPPAARLSIADNGSGIPQDVIRRIFEPFVTTKGETGTGLGLWVSAEIARKNHWAIQVRSSTGPSHPGTTFSILIPLANAHAEDAQTGSDAQQPRQESGAQHPRQDSSAQEPRQDSNTSQILPLPNRTEAAPPVHQAFQ